MTGADVAGMTGPVFTVHHLDGTKTVTSSVAPPADSRESIRQVIAELLEEARCTGYTEGMGVWLTSLADRLERALGDLPIE